jgi:CHAD domain-containing protein
MAQPPEFAEVEFPPIVSEPADCSAPLGISAQSIVLRYFREMLEQREPAWRADDAEAVHKLRVAARRTRTALQTFSVLWDSSREAQQHLRSLSEFADAFNAARDLDVMIIYLGEQLVKADEHRRPAITWLLTRNEKLREEQRPKLHKALRKLEKQRVPEKFVAYFSRKPYDLWPPLSESRAGALAGELAKEKATSPGSDNYKDEADDNDAKVGNLTGEAPALPVEEPHGAQ